MSVFGEEIIDRLHENSSLRSIGNPMRKIIDDGVGEWFDRFVEEHDFDDFFLDSATGGYLDAWGREFNVPRRLDESDDDYRHRIVLESLGHLTVPYLQEVYGLVLYCYVTGFDIKDNMLTSDNPFLSTRYMTVASPGIQEILFKKFVINNELLCIDLNTPLDYILDVNDVDVTFKYMRIYNVSNGLRLFQGNTTIKSVRLSFPNFTKIDRIFSGCTNLVNLILSVPSLPDDYPFLNELEGCDLKTIDITLPEALVDDFITYVETLGLTLDSFVVNGEEVDLS